MTRKMDAYSHELSPNSNLVEACQQYKTPVSTESTQLSVNRTVLVQHKARLSKDW